MTTEQKITQYKSFLLRLWQEEQAESLAGWQGEVESIQTGQKWSFVDLVTMADFLQAQIVGKPATKSAPKPDHSAGCERPFRNRSQF